MFSARLPVSSAGYTLLTARDAANQDITSQQPSMVTVAAHPAQMIHIIHIVWCYCVKLYCDLQSALLTVRVCQFSSNLFVSFLLIFGGHPSPLSLMDIKV